MTLVTIYYERISDYTTSPPSRAGGNGARPLHRREYKLNMNF